MSIRLRLTLLYTAILMLTLVLFSASLYVTVRQVTLGAVKRSLQAESARVIDRAGLDQFGTLSLPAETFATKETFFQVRSPDGQVLKGTRNLYGREIPLWAGGRSVLNGGEPAADIVAPPNSNERWMVYTTPIEIEGQHLGILQTARSLEDQDRALSALGRLLIIGTVIATLLAFGIGWLLAGMALRPINRITQTAQAIGAERDFGRRLSYSGPPDEIGRLASTFNVMLAQLGGAYSQVEQALRAQRRFVADASHELRTPLTSIRGNLALLRRQPPISEEDRTAVLADTEEESERMIRLVNDLLLLARADAGRSVTLQPVVLGDVIDEVCRQVRGLAPDREVSCEDSKEVVALADRDALKQVLLILLDNAVKFTGPGGRIEVSMSSSGDKASVSVQDNGTGISEEDLPHIFERFYQSDSSRTDAGLGLGLAIAAQLVEAQGGTLTVRSTQGEGSTFTLCLPKTAQERDPQSARSPLSQAASRS